MSIDLEHDHMSKTKLIGCLALFTALTLAAMNPAAAADRKTTNTILGAGIGAAAGAVLSQGDTLATLGGAAAGGVLGHILTEEPRKRRPSARSHSRHHHHVHHRGKPHHVHYAGPGKGKWKHSRHKHRHGKGRHHR